MPCRQLATPGVFRLYKCTEIHPKRFLFGIDTWNRVRFTDPKRFVGFFPGVNHAVAFESLLLPVYSIVLPMRRGSCSNDGRGARRRL